MRRSKRNSRQAILQASGVMAFLGAAQAVALVVRSPMLPPPTSVLQMVFEVLASGEILEHIQSSLTIVISGIGAAVATGFLTGLLFFLSPAIEVAAMPVLNALRPISAIALMPLFIILFGIGYTTKVIIIFWTAWPAVLLNTSHGLKTVDKDIIGAARIDGANEIQVLTIIVPIAGQAILTGARIGISSGCISLVAAEMIGADSGLGFYVLLQSQCFAFSKMFAGIIYIAIIGLCMNALLEYFQRRSA